MKQVKIFLGVVALTGVGVLLFCVFGIVVGLLLSGLAALLGLEDGLGLSPSIVLLFIILVMPKGWVLKRLTLERPYTCHATTQIDAPLSEVWDHVRPRPRHDHYQSAMKEIRAVEKQPDRFDFVFDRRFVSQDDASNLLSTPKHLEMTVEEVQRGEYLRFSYLNAHALPLIGKDIKNTEFWFERKDGMTHVTTAENFHRLTLIGLLMFLFLNPAKDGLKQLKAHCEGRPDPSWMGKQARETGPKGEMSDANRATSLTILFAVTSSITLMTFGVVWMVLS